MSSESEFEIKLRCVEIIVGEMEETAVALGFKIDEPADREARDTIDRMLRRIVRYQAREKSQ